MTLMELWINYRMINMNYSDFFYKTKCALLICKNDRYSTVIEANNTFFDLVGYSKEEFSTKFNNKFALLLLDDLEEILKKVKKVYSNGNVLDYEYRIRHKNGKTLWIHDIATYIPELDIFYVAIMDISYKTILLEQERKMQYLEATRKAKETFISYISHDIRTPLNGILGMAHLAKESIQHEEKVEGYLNKLVTSGNHLKLLVDSVLRIFEIDSEMTKVNLSPISLEVLVEEIVTIVTPLSEAKHQNIKIKNNIINSDVTSDEFLIREIFINLLSNAIKYTNEFGNITIEINQGSKLGSSVYEYEFNVMDNGIGISEDALESILQPFYRGQNAKENSEEGNGIGLSIVKSYIGFLQGRLDIKSRLGEGSIFTVKIPMEITNTIIPSQEKSNSVEIINTEKKMLKILVAEDNEINAEIIETILSSSFCEVTIAKNGREVVDIFKKSELNYYDCILMDINMPIIDGYEASILIRNSFREDQNIPIYALSAMVFPKEINTTNKVGMNGYITKPIDLVAINNILNTLY